MRVEELLEKLTWFQDAYPKKHRIKLSFAQRTIEKSLGQSLPSELILDFLKALRYKHVDVDVERFVSPVATMSKEKESDEFTKRNSTQSDDWDDIDALLNRELVPNIGGAVEQANSNDYHDNRRLLEEYKRTNHPALLQQLVESNMRLVYNVALKCKKYMVHDLTEEDLCHEGVFGLIEAIDRYDPTFNGSLSTYAVLWIRQKILRAICNTGTTVRIPVHMLERIKLIKKTRIKLIIKQNYENVTMQDICDELGISEDQYCDAMKAEHRFLGFISINQPINEVDGDLELGDFVPNDRLEVFCTHPEEFEDPAILAEKKEIQRAVHSLMMNLTERESEVLSYRYGFKDGTPRTLEEVGRVFGLTRERIRQIESKALGRLQYINRKQKIL
ncbi:sigma-70 family RNA polymerase sigma factor [Paenibacillus glycanilyticus]|uniref:RNA polymerase sigma-70 domain-containing protein n=1 Tax=Paenibacillus glycanilyticus TaxID=126569 RepID=A0ABQ6G602_9BACL|nr:sigma-70 family RNA polymerase sigma factor [Paenibacillus glycanilyticus]GLX65735.1 hypothetical protein MU1_00790 [Paenibacillus glycanilyticus]